MKGTSRKDIDSAVQDAKREATTRFLSRSEIGTPSAYAVSARPQQNVVAAGSVRYILSNNHVLADENSLPIGSAIFQPGLLDHGKVSTDQIARLTRFVPLKAGAANVVDAAIAEVLVAKSVRPRVLGKV